LCAILIAYLRLFRILKADFAPLHRLRGRRGAIIAVNHPTFLDAILMMSQLSGVFCLMKAKLHRNPFIAAIVRSAGYEDNANADQLIENCSRRLRSGETLLVFPEGTRTTVPPVGQLKRGFALMAIRAHAPVVTILMTSLNGPYLRKGQPFFAFPPAFPIEYRVTHGQEFSSLPDEPSRDFCLKIESYFREALPAQK
jgi:1-acyl-sn-glycerol-3-phosphate acyltransferase